MKTFRIVVALYSLLSFSCTPDKCEVEARSWIKEAPHKLEEFFAVKQEILANKPLLDSFTRKGLFYVGGPNGPEKFAGFNVPRLKQWFSAGHGSISFQAGDTSAALRSCSSNTSAWSYLHFGPIGRKKYSSRVVIVDTMKLRDGWWAEVTACDGCDS
ncbi:MAG TPA: hypothetical protein VHK69_06220 [Chitinophagaceae bacterium]|jgi:hypothetical protein|nr:hypothetical protein [Chitinophagaceae bacterium]